LFKDYSGLGYRGGYDCRYSYGKAQFGLRAENVMLLLQVWVSTPDPVILPHFSVMETWMTVIFALNQRSRGLSHSQETGDVSLTQGSPSRPF